MARSRDRRGYTLLINLKHTEGVSRLFQVIARAPDDYYGIRPVEGASKLSRHASGQSHIRLANGELAGKHSSESARPDRIVFPHTIWFVRVEGPKSLELYTNQSADRIFEVDWAALPTDRYVYTVEIALGRKFDLEEGYFGDGQYLAQGEVFPIPVSQSSVSMRFQLVGTPKDQVRDLPGLPRSEGITGSGRPSLPE